MTAGLEITDLSIRFGGVVALDDVAFSVPPQTIVALIGPNGAGKTTVFNCISRLSKPDRGRLTFEGRDLLRVRGDRMVSLGIARTFQHLELFRTMTVADNVLAGQTAHGRLHFGQIGLATGAGALAGAALGTVAGGDALSAAMGTAALGAGVAGLSAVRGIRLPFVAREEAAQRERADEVLDFLGLTPYRDQAASSLPYGIQKRVDIARALASRPKLLLMDEPAAGLSHEDMGALADLILRIRDQFNAAVLLVEHHMQLVMGISDRVCVLDFGRKIAEGTPAEVGTDPAVIEAYLGVAEAGPADAADR